MMKKLPINISSFSTLRKEGYLYVDKTEDIYNLITRERLYFLSRPRRFGKSLLLSALRELFLGNKQLFQGLWIAEKSSYDWPVHPVISLDFSRLSFSSTQELMESLSWVITHIAQDSGIDVHDAPNPGLKMQVLVEELSKKNKVVILIDEYDSPIINSVENIEVAKGNRAILRQFFSTIKSLDEHIRAFFLTGVSNFSKTSLFSGLNNVNDITLNPIAGTLLGYTKEEILHVFDPYLQQAAIELSTPVNIFMEKLTEWYDGYRFSKKEDLVYNPCSVLYLLQTKEFDNYWFTTGTPAFLTHLLKSQYSQMMNLNMIGVSKENLGPFEIDAIPLIPLLYQSGYLTIKEYNRETNLYTLDMPNREVRESFNKYLLATFTGTDAVTVQSAIPQLMTSLNSGNTSLFMSLLQSLFAHIPFQLHIPQERYYHSLFQLLVSMLSQDAQSEIVTDKGRIDLVIKVRNFVYLFEIKLDGTPEDALKQIEEKKYYERYLIDRSRIFLIGVSFNQLEQRLHIKYRVKEF